MQKKIGIVIAILFVIFIALLAGIGKFFLENQRNNQALTVNLVLTSDTSKPIVVPNPAETNRNVSVAMHYFPEHSEEKPEFYKSNVVDLSYLGFKEYVTILAYKIGFVTTRKTGDRLLKYNVSSEDISKMEGDRQQAREVNGTCLVLLVKEGIATDDSQNYVVLLDYENRKRHFCKTEIWNPEFEHIPELELNDITGDGLGDILVSNALNKGYAHFQVYSSWMEH